MTSSAIYKKALSHTAIYGASDVLRKIVGFLMLPIYTSYLTPADYGVVELMMLAIVTVEILFGMRMAQAVFKYYYMAKDADEKKTVIFTSFIMALCTSTIAFIVLIANAGAAAEIMIGDTRYVDLMKLLSILLVTQALEGYGLIFIRVQQRAVLYFVLSVSKLIVSLSLNIYFIVYLELTVAGIVYSACISTGLMAVFGTIYIFFHTGISFSKSLLKRLVIFSYPLWIAAVGSFYAYSSVTYFIRIFLGLDDVGLYALAAKFATLVLVFVWLPFSNIWESLRYETYKMPEPNKIYNNIFLMLMLVLSLTGLGLSLFSDIIIHLIADKKFWLAGNVVPLIVLSLIVKALTSFNNFGLLLEGKTSVIAVGTYLNAIVITIGFFILIPMAGLYGAAVSTFLGTTVQLIWIEWQSKKYYDMELPWWRFTLLTLTWMACYSISLLLPDIMLVSVVGKLLIFFAFIWLMFGMRIFTKEEKRQFLHYTKLAIVKAKTFIT